jgi:DNA-binding FadR family transcriptional regulator
VPEAIGYHEAVVEAVCAADPDLAEQSMITLLRDVRGALELGACRLCVISVQVTRWVP